MIDKLLYDIKAYIEMLKGNGFYITIHGDIGEYLYKLSKYNLHDNPFCVFVKSDDAAWKKCTASQCKIFSACGRHPFWGMCWAGIEEYIFPVWDHQKLFAFISVSGYAVNKTEAMRRIHSASKQFFLDRETLTDIYLNRLNHTKPDETVLSVIIEPLCHMLVLLNILKPPGSAASGDHYIFNAAVAYIERNFMKTIYLEEIAQHCSCSVSTLCHVFRKSCGKSIQEMLLEIRMQNAQKLLVNSSLSVGGIAGLCGFADPNYFSAVFKKYCGRSPSQYRKTAP